MVQMDSEKHSRRTQKQEDFLSKLPDDVVGGILSRLPTKEAVRTSLLSKKWRYLWTLVYNLDFSVCTRSRSDGMACDSSSFRSFLYQVLRLLKSKNIGRFKLNWRGLERTDLLCANSCIQYAVDHNVAELDLLLSSGRRNLVHLPSSISTCRSLEVLNLGCDFVLNVPTTVECFVSLKILRVSAKLPDCESLSNLFCNCPVLEELFFVWQPKATDDAGMIFHISVPSLKKLAIERVVEEFELCSTDKFVIQTPKLESLQIIDESLSSFLMDEMPSLVEANVYFGVTMVKCQEIASYEASRAARIVRGIRMTKFLVLSDCTVACLSYAFKDNLPKFPFLVHLQLGIDSYFGWKLLPHFLESANELEVLVLVKESIWIYNDMLANDYDGEYVQEMDFYWIAPKHVPHCLSYHVKEIKMVGLWGSEDEVEVVRYLLGNGKVLKKMSIEFSRDALKQELNETMITGFQRVSNECEIEFL